MADAQPIIIIKKKGHHGGHHGGAWKVAYADFVTAMMALFIVLWLLSSTSKQTQEQIAGYFNDPKGTANKRGSEGQPGAKAQDKHPTDMSALKKQLLLAMQNVDILNKLRKQIEITVTDEGLRVDLIEDKNGTFFELGSAKPTPALQEILKVLSGELKQLPNRISIEGHTDAQPYADHAEYDNWELSSDRANEARREMRADNIRAGQVSEVRGFADQQLRIPDKPYDPANRRVSIVVEPLPASAHLAQKPESQAIAASEAKKPGQSAEEVSSAATPDTVSTPQEGSPEQPTIMGETAPGRGLPKNADQPQLGFFQRIKKVFSKSSLYKKARTQSKSSAG